MKLNVTPELASLLKTARVRNGVSAKDVAEHMGKSPSYLSKLEGGSVRTVESSLLRDLLVFEYGGAGFYETVLPDVAALLKGMASGSRMVDQVWFLHFDVIERPVNVPQGMARDMARILDGMHVTPAQLAALLNANIDSEMPDTFPANQVIVVDYEGSNRLLMRVQIEESTVDRVVRGIDSSTSYFVLYNIVHAMLRLQRFPGVHEKLPPSEAVQVLSAVAEYMSRWEVHSLAGYSHFLSSQEFIDYQLPLAQAQSGAVERICMQLDQMVRRDSLHAVNELGEFCATLEWDPAFALKVLGLPFSSLGAMSYSHKRRLIGEITALVQKYNSMDEFERKIETY